MEKLARVRAGAWSALCALAVLAVVFGLGPARAAGDLAVKSVMLEPLVLGKGNDDYAVSVKEYELETGKSYRLTIAASGFKSYALVAPEFFRNIWIRWVSAGDVEIRAPVLDGFDFEDEAEVELSFVPIRPGRFEFKVLGLEEKGMVGHFVVK